MKLNEFLKYYIANKPTIFGDFVRSRRCEFGYSVREFAKILGISAMYLSDIENGKRPAPTNLLPTFLSELQVSEDEHNQFMDLVYLSRESWPSINSYITSHPSARKFIQLANSKGLKNDYFDKLISQLENENNNESEKEF